MRSFVINSDESFMIFLSQTTLKFTNAWKIFERR